MSLKQIARDAAHNAGIDWTRNLQDDTDCVHEMADAVALAVLKELKRFAHGTMPDNEVIEVLEIDHLIEHFDQRETP